MPVSYLRRTRRPDTPRVDSLADIGKIVKPSQPAPDPMKAAQMAMFAVDQQPAPHSAGDAALAECERILQDHTKAVKRKGIVWRNPRIARLESLVAALNRELDELKFIETYERAHARDLAHGNTQSKQAARDKAFDDLWMK